MYVDPWIGELDESEWGEAVAELPPRYQRACALARLAEYELDAESVDDLTLDLLAVEDQEQFDEFVKKLTRSVSRVARKTVRDLGRTPIGRTIDDVGRSKLARTVGRTVRDVGRGVEKAGRAVPMLSTVAKLASRGTPLGALARATYGAASAALSGKNIFLGALDGLGGSAIAGALIQMGASVVRGDSLAKAAKMALKAGVSDVKDAVRLAAMVAPFIPGIGTGVGAALGAADALANGQPITQALIAGVRGAIPGGVIAQAAFDTAAQLAQGKRLDEALLTAARNRLPPGAQTAFDAGLAIAQGKKLQEAAIQAAGRLLPASPYSADLQAFARRALAGDNLGQAAISTAGHAVLRRVREQGGDLVATVQGRAQAAVGAQIAAVAPAAARITGAAQAGARVAAAAQAGARVTAAAPPVTLDRMIAASNVVERRRANDFFASMGASQPTRGAK